MKIDHWMIFSTFVEQDYFEYPTQGTYKGVVINANMASHAPAGLSAFLVEKTAVNTKYLIDPLTHAFQHDPGVIKNSEGETKSSIKKLSKSYGEPVSKFVGKRPVLPEDFSNSKILEKFVLNCLNFQRRQLADSMTNLDAAKYMDVDSEIRPYALIPPYFFLTEATIDEWIDINKNAAQIAIDNMETDEKCFAAIVINRGVLVSEKARDTLLEAFSDIRLAGFILWVDNLDERFASTVELNSLLNLGNKLRRNGEREVINLHGGYFSILAAGSLGKGALSGVAHAPEFGEFRPVVPVGGGIPISRYYIPELHARVRYREALSIFQFKKWLDSANSFYENVCSCRECRNTLNGDTGNFIKFGDSVTKTIRRKNSLVRIDFPTREARIRCLKHYLQMKKKEYKAAADAPMQELLDNLKNGEEIFREVLGLDGIAHLRRWNQIFNN